ncbi:Uncharacterised protein [uncultured archaeon]|nr:Uncharacterised protein [uncultured archaeon]
MKDVPRTGAELLRRGLFIGHEAGLKYVYAGNIPGESEDTRCPVCRGGADRAPGLQGHEELNTY